MTRNLRENWGLVARHIPSCVLLWLAADTFARHTFYEGRVGHTVPLAVVVGQFATWFVSGFASASVGASDTTSCRAFLSALLSRIGYTLAFAVPASCAIGAITYAALVFSWGWFSLTLACISLVLTVVFVFAGAVASAQQVAPIRAARCSVSLISNRTGIAILVVPVILLVVWDPLAMRLMARALDPDTASILRLTGLAVIKGVAAAIAAVYVWSRMNPSRPMSAAAFGDRCIVVPTTIVLSGLIGALLYAALFEALPGDVLGVGTFPWQGGVPHVLNLPYSIGSLLMAALGVVLVSWINGWNLAASVVSVVLARVVFISRVQDFGPAADACRAHYPIARVIGVAPCQYPGYYIAGLAVFAVLAAACVLTVRSVRRCRAT